VQDQANAWRAEAPVIILKTPQKGEGKDPGRRSRASRLCRGLGHGD
jgi:hypothetical protein